MKRKENTIHKKKSTVRKRRFLWLPIAAGFLILYVTVMVLSTYLVKGKFMDDFEARYISGSGQVYQLIMDKEKEEKWYLSGAEERESYYNMLLSRGFLRGTNKYQQFSGAIYDVNGNLIAKSQNLLQGVVRSEINYYPAEDYLSETEIRQLAKYMEESYQQAAKNNNLSDYRITAVIMEDTLELKQMVVQRIVWEENGLPKIDELTGNEHSVTIGGKDGDYRNHTYVQTDSEIVWEWKNPNIAEESEAFPYELTPAEYFPYIQYGYASWKRWMENEFLQNLGYENENRLTLLEDNESVNKYRELNRFKEQTSRDYDIYIEETGEKVYKFLYATDCQPWLAAMDYMKYVYFAGFILMLVCAGVLAYFTDKTYRQRIALEETRRDFTNTMAHELKTPLGIIRGFAENLEENTVESKREYYLKQIVAQTEEMDRLVKEMIDVSRLDSEYLVLQQARLSINEIIKEQLEKLEPGIAEKNLQINYQSVADFVIEGDGKYLSRAIGNLLSNAVSYNIQDGTIWIHIEAERFTIENTGEQIPEEELPRIYEMMHRGKETTVSREKHLGMGLYLSKKIMTLHHLKLNIRNTETGVIVMVSK